VAPSDAWSTGRATLTTVPSTNAMLEPRMLAANTHDSVEPSAGTESGAPSTSPALQGVLSAVKKPSFPRTSVFTFIESEYRRIVTELP
jgi:hypothetical protein